MMGGRAWSDAETDLVRAYADRPGHEVAEMIGRTVGAVWRRRGVLGITDHKRGPKSGGSADKTAAIRETIRAGRAAGWCYEAIGAELGITRQAVGYHVRKMRMGARA